MHAWVVEDNDQNFELVDYLLTEGGWQTSRARSGADLLALFGAPLPTVILLDMNLPDASGLELAARIRSDPRFAAVPVVAVTAHAMSGDRERCLAAGCDAYIAKPLDPAGFVAEIEAVVSAGFGGSVRARPQGKGG